MAAPPDEVELEGEVEEEPLLVEEEAEVVSVAVEVEVDSFDLVWPVFEADEVKLWLPVTVPVPTGEDRPAGTEAAGCWEVTGSGWLVTAVG